VNIIVNSGNLDVSVKETPKCLTDYIFYFYADCYSDRSSCQ